MDHYLLKKAQFLCSRAFHIKIGTAINISQKDLNLLLSLGCSTPSQADFHSPVLAPTALQKLRVSPHPLIKNKNE